MDHETLVPTQEKQGHRCEHVGTLSSCSFIVLLAWIILSMTPVNFRSAGVSKMTQMALDKAPCCSAGSFRLKGRFLPFQSAALAQKWRLRPRRGSWCTAGAPADEKRQKMQVNRALIMFVQILARAHQQREDTLNALIICWGLGFMHWTNHAEIC